MNRSRKYFLIVLVGYCALSAGLLCAQHPAWQNYTVNNGLPSNGIYAMIQDSRGYLWIGTSQGMCRFNGYEFTRPIDTSVVAQASVCHILEDTKGRIWFNRIDGTLSIIENDTVRSWAYNGLIKPFVKENRATLRFAIDQNGAVWICSWNGGILIVQQDGSQQIISTHNNIAILFSKVGNQLISAGDYNVAAKAQFDSLMSTRKSGEVFRFGGGKKISLGRFPLDYAQVNNAIGGFWLWPLKNGQIIGNISSTYYLVKDDQLVWSGQKDGNAKAIFENSDGSILMAVPNGANEGLLRFRSIEHFKRNEFENLLPGKPVVQIVQDREGGWWVSTVNSGVFYCKNPKIGLFDRSNGLPSNEVNTLASDGRDRIFAGLPQLDIAVLKRGRGISLLLPHAPITEMQALRFDTITGRLWAANDLCYLERDRWNFTRWKNPTGLRDRQIPIKKITPEILGTHWWASSNVGIFLIDPVAGVGTLDSILNVRTFSVNPNPDGTLWITTMEGLRFMRNGHLIPPLFSHPALRYNPLYLASLPQSVGGGVAMVLVGGGILIRDQKGNFSHLTTKDGLSSNRLGDLEISPNGVIYVSSSAGLNILRRQTNGQWQVEILGIKHGLPSNQINDVLLQGAETWIATDGGIVLFSEKPTPAPMPMPILEKFVVNNQDKAFSNNLQLPHDQNNLSLRFFALHFRSSGDIPYRYRLLGADTTFVFTRTREVNFANLATGKYTFEVQAQNEDGQWSEPSKWAFAILPPWWATWWFRTLVVAALAAAAYLFYQERIQSIRQKAEAREKIRDLETAALRAQMNPHFIFNCLQAIQSFIVQNDRDAATTYLARFAKLVRLALHGSVDGRHSLSEEIAMLDNYLHLEQMRFWGKFEFEIRSEGLEREEISLPPMLVQPFVENALIHGLQNQNGNGRIEVVFSKKENSIQVLVKDNGKGFSEDAKDLDAKPGHKSVGMMLTQKRLDLLVGPEIGASESLVRKTVWDEKGNPIGAIVEILIPLL